jgi:hypothetical protein
MSLGILSAYDESQENPDKAQEKKRLPRRFLAQIKAKKPAPPGQKPDGQMIDEWLRQNAVSKLPTRYATGSIKANALGFDV